MPYIKQDRRPECDAVVELMKKINVKADGDLNYILYKFCKESVSPSYNSYKNYCGELTECAVEIRRRILADYETERMKENGDV